MQPHFGPTSKTKKPYSWDSKQKPWKSGFIWNLSFTILNKTHNFEVGQQNSRLVLFSFYVYKIEIDLRTQGYKMVISHPPTPLFCCLVCPVAALLVIKCGCGRRFLYAAEALAILAFSPWIWMYICLIITKLKETFAIRPNLYAQLCREKCFWEMQTFLASEREEKLQLALKSVRHSHPGALLVLIVIWPFHQFHHTGLSESAMYCAKNTLVVTLSSFSKQPNVYI